MKMIYRNILILILALTIPACTSSSVIQHNSLSEINRKLSGQSAVISMTSGETYNGKGIELSDTSSTFINQMNDSLTVIRTKDIESIYFKHRAGGAIEGLLLGASIGAAGGLIGSMNIGSGSDAKGGRVISGVIGGVIGGLAGLAAGISKGHEYIYKMPQDSTFINK